MKCYIIIEHKKRQLIVSVHMCNLDRLLCPIKFFKFWFNKLITKWIAKFANGYTRHSVINKNNKI